jgi:ribosome biogenesis GTPase
VIRALEQNKIARVRYENYRALYEELKNQKPVYGKKEKS